MGRFRQLVFVAFLLFLALATRLSNARGLKNSDKKADGGVRLKGRFTRDIEDYEVVIPRKVTADGKFVSFAIPHFYERRSERRGRRRRHANETDADAVDDRVHYAVTFGGRTHHIELVPNHDFLSPGLVVETRDARHLGESTLRRVRRPQCHYTGWVRGEDGSRVALSVCDGATGFLRTARGHFYIEPAHGQTPAEDGRHLHLVYRDQGRHDAAPAPNCNVGGWERAWAERMRAELREGRPLRMPRPGSEPGSEPGASAGSEGEPAKRSVSKARFIEAMVVADRKFIQHHNGTDVEAYILTIMNMVSDFYHDSSIGNQIEFVVVRIVFLEKEKDEMDLMISPNAEKTLDSFCEWQHKINPNITHPSHHDVAVLLTRYDICSNNLTNCGLVGLANVAAACSSARSCCINEDKGLALAVTVSHEVGHVLGCAHDSEEESGCSPQAEDKSFHVMSPMLKFHTTRWSTCSKKFVTEFLDGGLGECLLDEPQDQNFDIPEMPVGAMYDADFQCELNFGEGAKACKRGTDTFCQTLWCELTPNSCTSNGDPAADGTSCGNNMWCYDEKCVEIGERPGAVDGGWGAYGPWSECSRTCGGGVRAQERFCDSPAPQNRGRYCIGRRKQYETCNTTPCGENVTPFREQQCAEHNKKKFNNKLHKWKPFKPQGTFNPCALICENELHSFATLAPRVKDGTKCRPGSKDLCVSGMCTKVGCDWQIDSDAVDDQCGICRGDGTQCVLIEGLFNQTTGHGYVEVVTIPKGSRNIQIEEVKPVGNSLAVSAVSNGTKKYYLNGDFKENPDGEYRFGTAIGIYCHPEVEREELEIAGPTSEDLVIYEIFYGNENPGVRYKFFVPSANTSYLPKYNWEFLEWGPCSARCGTGSEISEASCVETHTGKVSNTFCHQSDRPHPKSRVCDQRPCKTRWKTGAWSACEGSNGKGLMHRKVACVREAPHMDEPDVEVPVDECKEAKPKHSKECDLLEDAPPKREVPVRQGKAAKKRDDGGCGGNKTKRKKKKECGSEHNKEKSCESEHKKENGCESEHKKEKQCEEEHKKEKSCEPEHKKEKGCESEHKKEKCCESEHKKEKECDSEHKKVEHEKTCEKEVVHDECEKMKAVNVTVEDRICPDDIVFMEAAIVKVKPKNATSCPGHGDDEDSTEFSDEAVETLGDKVPELTLDLKNEVVVTGEKAVKKYKHLKEPHRSSCHAQKKRGV